MLIVHRNTLTIISWLHYEWFVVQVTQIHTLLMIGHLLDKNRNDASYRWPGLRLTSLCWEPSKNRRTNSRHKNVFKLIPYSHRVKSVLHQSLRMNIYIYTQRPFKELLFNNNNKNLLNFALNCLVHRCLSAASQNALQTQCSYTGLTNLPSHISGTEVRTKSHESTHLS